MTGMHASDYRDERWRFLRVERLRFDAARCELHFSKGVASNIEEGIAEIERLTDALAFMEKRALREQAEIERLRMALKDVIADIHEYERVNNLAPNPPRIECWDSVARALKALEGK